MDIRSGHIFVFEEHESGIKRWTDGIHWSPSRVSDAFILYRELDGEQVGAGKRKRLIPAEERALDHQETADSNLYGSLVNSYPFKSDGLMKKTISMKLDELSWRLVSYYRPEDVRLGHVRPPSQDPSLSSVPRILSIRQTLQCRGDRGSPMIGHPGHPAWAHGAQSLPAFPHDETGAMACMNDHAWWYSG